MIIARKLTLKITDARAGELALWREPESLVDLARELLAEVLLESSQFTVGRESFDVHVGGEKDRVPGSLVNSATLHSFNCKRFNCVRAQSRGIDVFFYSRECATLLVF